MIDAHRAPVAQCGDKSGAPPSISKALSSLHLSADNTSASQGSLSPNRITSGSKRAAASSFHRDHHQRSSPDLTHLHPQPQMTLGSTTPIRAPLPHNVSQGEHKVTVKRPVDALFPRSFTLDQAMATAELLSGSTLFGTLSKPNSTASTKKHGQLRVRPKKTTRCGKSGKAAGRPKSRLPVMPSEKQPTIISVEDDSDESLSEAEADLETGDAAPSPVPDRPTKRKRVADQAKDGQYAEFRASILLRNPLLNAVTQEVLEEYVWGLNVLKSGVFVSLQSAGLTLEIKRIIRDKFSEEVQLCGNRYQSAETVDVVPASFAGEVCRIAEVHSDDVRPEEERSMETVPLGQVTGVLSVCMVNTVSRADIEAAQLRNTKLCRFKITTIYPLKEAEREQSIVVFRQNECDRSGSVEDWHLREAWRGESVKGGSQVGWLPGEKDFLQLETKVSQVRGNTGELVDNIKLWKQEARGAVGEIFQQMGPESHWFRRTANNSGYKVREELVNFEDGTVRPYERFQHPGDDEFDKWPHSADEDSDVQVVDTVNLVSSDEGDGSNDVTMSAFGDFGGQEVPLPDLSMVEQPTSASTRYTLTDCFAGAGGMSRGAVLAGLRVNVAFDMDGDACASYARNFYKAKVCIASAQDFYNERLPIGRVIGAKSDLCHLSPPCQPQVQSEST